MNTNRLENLLKNPVYHGLVTGDRKLALGTAQVKYFDAQVSPFAGFDDGYEKGFDDLHDLLPEGRVILYATPGKIETPKGWHLLAAINGLQMIFASGQVPAIGDYQLVPLSEADVPQMVDLATLTRPGPFGTRTIEFGHYHGIFEGSKLAAMTGQRLHVENHSEISAVCTYPEYLGKGYATALVRHQLQLITEMNQVPFLHVRDDNTRAIELYQRQGFTINGPMNFYFMKRA